MKDNQQIYIILGIVLFIATFFLIAAVFLEKQKKKRIATKQVHKGRENDFWFVLYRLFNKFILTKRYMQRIRKRIEIIEMSDNWTVSRKTARFSFISLGLSFLMFIVLLLINLNLYYMIIGIVTIIVINNQIVSLLVDKMENKLMGQFDKFLGDIRHHYYEHGMIDEAIYDAIEDCKYEMSLHANKMYEILTSNDPESEIEKYNDLAPNKFFKTFLANCYTVQLFGDKIVDNESVFLSNLTYLKQEINMEMLRRQKLDYLFNSLSFIAIAPIFALKPLEVWGISNLPEMAEYYKGAYGFVVQVVLFLIIILSYQLINNLRRDYEYNEVSSNVFDKLLHISFVADFIRILRNKQYSKSLRIADLMKIAGIHQSVENFYLKRIAYAGIGLVACIFIFVNMHAITKNNILYSSQDLIKQTDNIDKKAEQELILMDHKFVIEFKGKNVTYQDIKDAVIKSGGISNDGLADIATARILAKVKQYNKQYFHWWELLLSLGAAILFYHIPYWLMVFRKKVMQMNMEDEVMQFHTIILMLMHIERMSVEDILKWMEQFAVIFKDSISKCLNNFENGDEEALEQLKVDEPFVPFARIVENLQSASDKIPIERAFDQLKVERGYYQDKRKQENEIIVNKKGMWGKMIAYVPIGATIFLYLLLPFVLISLNQLYSYSDQMKGAF